MAKGIQREPLNFGNSQQSGHEELAGASPLAVNVIVDAAGAVHRRPGLESTSRIRDVVSQEAPIIGLHSTATGRLFAVDGPTPFSRIYEVTPLEAYNLSQDVTGAPVGHETKLLGGRRPIFAETEAMLVIAAGDVPQKVLLSTPAASSPLGGGPPKCSHVIAHAMRLLVNQVDTPDTNTIRYSGQASGSSIEGHENWTVDIEDPAAPSYFRASARPDPVLALHENTNDVFGFGSTNLQMFVQGSGGFNFTAANTREFGCSAPYSVVKFDQNFGFVDGHRRIVLTDGRDYQFISHDIQQTLDDIADWSDVFGYRVTLGPIDALCWCSPTDGRTFAYQASTKSWSLWQSWNDTTNNFDSWHVRCALRVPETGEMLVGCAVGRPDDPKGDVFRLSNHSFRDRRDEHDKIVARVDTGFIDRGTSGRKLCRALRLTWRGTPSHDTAAFVQWRDDGGPWEHQRQIEIGYNSEVILRSLGVYRRRQWRVTFEGTNELVLARAEEEFELLAV